MGRRELPRITKFESVNVSSDLYTVIGIEISNDDNEIVFGPSIVFFEKELTRFAINQISYSMFRINKHVYWKELKITEKDIYHLYNTKKDETTKELITELTFTSLL